MKRWAVCLLFILLPMLALAEPQTPYGQGLSVRYSALPTEQQALVDLLYEAAQAHEEKVTVPEGTKYDDLSAAHDFLAEEYPELIALRSEATLYYYRNKPEEATDILMEYTMTAEEEQSILEDLFGTAQRMVDSAPTENLFERELYLHDALCDLVTYDLTTYSNSTAAVALLEGKATCEGYTRAMTLLCRMAGIPCSFVSGTDKESGESHAWNVLLLDGTACYTDVTWDDGSDSETVHWFFNLSEEQLAQTHDMTTAIDLPSDDRWEYHRVQGLVVDDDHSAVDGLKTAFTTGTDWSLRFTSQEAYEQFLTELLDVLDEARASVGLEPLNSIGYLVEDRAWCCLLYE
jgi:hypothetical protein